MKHSSLLVVFSLVGLWAGASLAAPLPLMPKKESLVPSTPQIPTTTIDYTSAMPALPLDVMTNGIVTYINGGIGDEELAELKSKKHEFNVHLLITGPRGEFVSDVGLRLSDASGAVVMTVSDAGPYTYIKLPAGKYTLEAASAHDSVVKKIPLIVPENGSVNKQLNFAEEGGITTRHTPTATND